MTEKGIIKFFQEQSRYIKSVGAFYPPQEIYEILFKMIEELQQYREIGTVEECLEAVEKQRAKKPILDTIYHHQYYCPNCEDFLARKNSNKPHHCICGQAIDWSDAI